MKNLKPFNFSIYIYFNQCYSLFLTKDYSTTNPVKEDVEFERRARGLLK